MTDHRPECIYTPEHFDPEQNIVWGGKPCICDALRACEQRVRDEIAADGPWFRSVVHQCCEDKQTAYAAGLDAAREAVLKDHRPVPVIECGCGWGKDCPECGEESNRVVGYACNACCNSFGDHAYCDDMHYDDDTPLHHQDGRWNGPHCPVIAAIDALREKP